jgi:sugar phosphate isomerase/epimerase
MKTSCSSWSYHRTIKNGKMDQLSWIKECAENGLDGVELLFCHFPSTEKDYMIKLKKECADNFLSVAMVSAGGHLTVGDDVKRESEIQDIRKWTDVACFMGAPCVRFFCGSGAELEAGGDDLYKKVRAAIAKIADFGAERGIVMAMENHGGTTAAQLLSLIRDVNHPFLKFALDTGNFPPTSQVGPETYSSIEKCVPHAAIVHAKFFNIQPDGSDRDFDWLKIHGILKKTGFNGFLSVEYEGSDDNEVEAVKKVAGFLKKLR